MGQLFLGQCLAAHGRICLATPTAAEMLHTNGKPPGKVLLYQPGREGGELKVTLPVEADGYCGLVGTHVYGAWKQGRYALCRVRCDGVALPRIHRCASSGIA